MDKKMAPWLGEPNPVARRALGKLLEELGELTAIAARSHIQGVDQVDPDRHTLNRDILEDEAADVIAGINRITEVLCLNKDAMALRIIKKAKRFQSWEEAIIDTGVKDE